jgi:hypothetical protein
MRTFNLTVVFLSCFVLSLHSQEKALFTLYGTQLVNDSANVVLSVNPALFRPVAAVDGYLQKKEAASLVLHTTLKGRSVEAFFFPGRSDKKALVIAGMHGSELSSIEIAQTLLRRLSTGEKPFYNVVIVPSLFPDNAQEALAAKKDRLRDNTGRYTNETAADPNRQMPPLGKSFSVHDPVDALQREIEGENAALLDLIQTYKPDRLISIHAIKDKTKAGIFADPRTDCSGTALGYDTDKALALLMAQAIQERGGACPGNNLQAQPSALYYLDPPIAEAGQKQERSFDGSKASGRGKGISLGSWASTAVCDAEEGFSRSAIRTFTMEFPGYQKSTEYKTVTDRKRFESMVQVYANSIYDFFLQSFFVEGEPTVNIRFASN